MPGQVKSLAAAPKPRAAPAAKGAAAKRTAPAVKPPIKRKPKAPPAAKSALPELDNDDMEVASPVVAPQVISLGMPTAF